MTACADLAVLFAGGAGRRMGGVDKGALVLGGETLAARMLDRLGQEAGAVAVSGRSRPDWLAQGGPDFIPDVAEGIGPAGGLLSALEWAAAQYAAEALVFTAPIDVPFYPEGLCARMIAGIGHAPGIVVREGEWLHPVFGVWRAGTAGRLRELVLSGNIRAMHAIVAQSGAMILDLEAAGHAFHNINTPDDLARAQTLLAGGG